MPDAVPLPGELALAALDPAGKYALPIRTLRQFLVSLELLLRLEHCSAGLAPDQESAMHGELVGNGLPTRVEALLARRAGPDELFFEIFMPISGEGLMDLGEVNLYKILLPLSEFQFLQARFGFFISHTLILAPLLKSDKLLKLDFGLLARTPCLLHCELLLRLLLLLDLRLSLLACEALISFSRIVCLALFLAWTIRC